MTEARPPWIVFSIPDDPALLAAFGRVTLHHSHLDYVLRLTIKTLSGLALNEALDATARESSWSLRERIRKHARQQLGEGPALLRLQALVQRCERLTERRNDVVHSVWGRHMDGEHVVRREDHSWVALPTIAELETLAADIRAVRDELNEARLTGFLAEALAKNGATV